MRRFISILIATALFAAGGYILAQQIAHGAFHGAALILGGFLAAIGAGWLWVEIRGM